MKKHKGASNKGIKSGNMPPSEMKATVSGMTTAESCNPTPVRMAKFLTAMLSACVTADETARIRAKPLSDAAKAATASKPTENKYAVVPSLQPAHVSKRVPPGPRFVNPFQANAHRDDERDHRRGADRRPRIRELSDNEPADDRHKRAEHHCLGVGEHRLDQITAHLVREALST
jgi:hypothetical protein